MRRSSIVLIGASVILPAAAAAQVQTTPIGPGASVRVWVPRQQLMKRKAVVHAIVGDTLILARDTLVVRRGQAVRDTTLAYVPLDGIERIEVMTGQRANIGGGLKWGVMIGGGIGTVLGLAATATCDDSGWNDCGPEWILAGALGGAFYGLLIGTVVGLLDKTEDWQQVWLTPAPRTPVLAPEVRVTRDGFTLGVRLRL